MKNKLIGLLIIMMCFMALGVGAFSMPHIVYGKITHDSNPVSGISVTYTNLDTGMSSKTITNYNGFYQFELGNFDTKYDDGHNLKVTVDFCSSNPICTGTATLSGGGDLISFDISGIVDVPTPIPTPEPTPSPTTESSVTSNEDDTITSLDVYYYELINVVIKNNKLAKLLDKEIEFNDEDYNTHEEIVLSGLEVQTSFSNTDFGTTPYLVIPRGAVDYKYVFDEVIPLSEITEDEPLKITLFGEEIEIIEASETEITIIRGEVHKNKKVGDKITVDGIEIEIIAIGEENIRVSCSETSESVTEGGTVDLCGIEVYLEFAGVYDDQPNLADLRIGEDIEIVIDDGDYLTDAEIWKYTIDLPYYISLYNKLDYDELDEDVKPLAEGDKLIIPNEIVIKVNKVTKPELTSIRVEEDDGWLRLRGDSDAFQYNGEEYDEVLLALSGIYDEDEELISIDKVRIGNSDTYLEVLEDVAQIQKLTIDLLMADIYYDGVSFANKDDDYLDAFGLIFKDPEEGVLDKRGFEIIVPEERPEVTITIGIEPIEITPDGCPKVDPDGVCPTLEKPTCSEPITCPEQKVCEICEETECPIVPVGTTPGELIILVIVSAFSVGAGIYFTRNKMIGKGGGIQTYYARDGTKKIIHKHPGIRGYHNPYTSHRDRIERHPRGQLFPHYEKNPIGIWVYTK